MLPPKLLKVITETNKLRECRNKTKLNRIVNKRLNSAERKNHECQISENDVERELSIEENCDWLNELS